MKGLAIALKRFARFVLELTLTQKVTSDEHERGSDPAFRGAGYLG
jgi:hypothetical protein